MVRRAHYERKKEYLFQFPPVRPELVEGYELFSNNTSRSL